MANDLITWAEAGARVQKAIKVNTDGNESNEVFDEYLKRVEESQQEMERNICDFMINGTKKDDQ